MNDVGPDALKDGPIRFDGFRGVATDECVDHADAELRRRPDHLFQMIRHHAAMVRIGIERIGIISQSGDGDSMFANQFLNAACFLIAEIGHVDVSDAGVTAIGAALGPTHRLDAGKTLVGREFQNFLKAKLAQNRADKTELHE